MLRRIAGGAIVGLLLLGWAQGASAHLRPVPEPVAPVQYDAGPDTFLVAGAPTLDPSLVWLLGALVVTLALAGRRSPRRAAALALVALIAVLAFETGLHSVHHLGDSDGHCAIASASAHVPGAEASPMDTAPILRLATDTLPAFGPSALPARFIRPDEGRAPPA